jgi:hypothetical protein
MARVRAAIVAIRSSGQMMVASKVSEPSIDPHDVKLTNDRCRYDNTANAETSDD